ncbi:MAG: TerC family protein [Bacteroidia bacterium]|nr:TerC family protein [Bacteroidia bacterium]
MDYQNIISLISLIALEIVLGIDNIIFISILASRLPLNQQKKARQIGLAVAAVSRVFLLMAISYIMKLDITLFSVLENNFSGKDLVLIGGGVFLLFKSTKEIYHKMEGEEGDVSGKIKSVTFLQVILQILLLDVIFSIDSIITAVGMVQSVWVMYAAVVITIIIMLFAAEPISGFINKHPGFKMQALAFLLLIGSTLVAEGFEVEIPKGYIYFAMAFSIFVGILQLRMKPKNIPPVITHEHYKHGEDKLDKSIL